MDRWPLVRDVVLFIGGMGGLYHETVLRVGERPTLIAAFLVMMGGPAYFRADLRRKQNGGGE